MKSKKITPIKSGILCIDCKEDIPQQRLDACKGTKKCVQCSNVKTKKPIVLHQGTGDNTYEELVVVDHETYEKHRKLEEATNRLILGKSSKNFFDEEPKIETGDKDFIK